eukprot:10444293-Ditylum_brightwellii.AAC.1
MSKLHKLHTRSIDFVLAYTQAEVKSVLYLHPPAGIILNTNGEDMVLKLRTDLYGLKDARRTWWEHLSEGLEKIGFRHCNIDQCIWTKEGIVVIVYVDDGLVFGNDESAVEVLVKELQKSFDITDEWKTVEEYLGVKIDHFQNRTFRMYQPHLMKKIIKAISGMERATKHKIPAATSSVITKDKDGKARQENWNYRSVIDLRAIHEAAVQHIIRYLLITQERNGRHTPAYGLNMRRAMTGGLEVYADASFGGEWNSACDEEPTSVLSRTGYINEYANPPSYRLRSP